MIVTYTTLTVLLLGIAVTCGYLIVKVPASYKLKWLLIPMVIAFSLLSIKTFPTLMGHAVDETPTKQFLYLHHLIIEKDGKKLIEVWLKTGDTTRLFVIPYSQQDEKQLNEAQKNLAQGIPTVGTARAKPATVQGFDGKAKNDGSGLETQQSLDLKAIPVQQILPPKSSL